MTRKSYNFVDRIRKAKTREERVALAEEAGRRCPDASDKTKRRWWRLAERGQR